MTRPWRLALPLTVILAACAGDLPSDRPSQQTLNPLDPVQQSPCSNDGLASQCDVVGGAGCQKGACYVIKDVGSACVCEPGAAETGEKCNTTADCTPGNVCAGTKAPGSCRLTCLPGFPDCPQGSTCIAIKGLDSFGYCAP